MKKANAAYPAMQAMPAEYNCLRNELDFVCDHDMTYEAKCGLITGLTKDPPMRYWLQTFVAYCGDHPEQALLEWNLLSLQAKSIEALAEPALRNFHQAKMTILHWYANC